MSASPRSLVICLVLALMIDFIGHTLALADDALALHTENGCVERIDPQTGTILGTLLSGLPAPTAFCILEDGCWLIAVDRPGRSSVVLRFDPEAPGAMTTWLDVPEGYGGRLNRVVSIVASGDDVFIASRGDGRVKRFAYPSGEWLGDVARVPADTLSQIAVHRGRIWLSDSQAHAIKRSSVLPRRVSDDHGDASPPESELTIAFQLDKETATGILGVGEAVFVSTREGSLYRLEMSDNEKISSQAWKQNDVRLRSESGLSADEHGNLWLVNKDGQLVQVSSTKEDTEPRVLTGETALTARHVLFTSKAPATEFVYRTAGLLEPTPEKLAFFETHIRPLLHERCLECHDAQTQEGKLRLDYRGGWEKGGRSGRAIVPGEPEQSLLMQAVSHLDKDLKMPPEQRLSEAQVALLEQWVRSGAIDPRRSNTPESGESIVNNTGSDPWSEEFEKRLDWWSLKPRADVGPPEIRDRDWPLEKIDHFLKQALERVGLEPAPPADPEVLLRRASIVLTGLPPSAQLREALLERWAVDEDAAYTWLVDRLLNSPRFGERMARHWMDVVRYTDTYGYEWDNPAKGSHEYRDYLIRAFNHDLPYDQFVTEQLAGDLIASPRLDDVLAINESLIGPMFYHLGEHRHGSSLAFNGIHQEMVNNKVDAFSKAFLAMTVACARCHDHKREAITQREYYALGAVFMTPRWVSRPVDAPGKNAHAIVQLKRLRGEIRQELSQRWSSYEISAESVRQFVQNAKKAEKPPQFALGQVAYPVWRLLTDKSLASERWTALVDEIKQAQSARQADVGRFQWLTRFESDELPTGWVKEGEGFEHGWVDHGEPLIALEGEGAITGLLVRGLHSHALSSKLPGVLRMPPQHQVPGSHTSLRLAGGQFSGSLVLDENSFQNETIAFFKDQQPTWRSYADQPLKNGVTRVTIDFATAGLHANFPPRTGLAPGLPHQDLGYDKRSWLSITEIATHDQRGTPAAELDTVIDLISPPTEPQSGDVTSKKDAPTTDGLTNNAPNTDEELIRRLQHWLQRSVTRWCAGRTGPGDVAVINWLLENKLLPNSLVDTQRLSSLVQEYRSIEQQIEFPRSVNSMDERQVEKAGLAFNVRGNVDAMGEQVMPDGLKMFGQLNRVAGSPGSGRMALVESVIDPRNPLTARVYVNRLWQWIFGQGLVTTPDDFGHLGSLPSHPEMLDWLAGELIREEWSTKRLVRQLMLSRTFRQSGLVSALGRQRDPGNRLLHHYPTRRMEAEAIRDSLLFVSGGMDHRLFGRPINPPRLVEDPAKRLFSGPIDGNGRRSLYLTMSIMAPPKFLTAFDLPDLKLPSGKRNITNVPTQALQMMNDPLVSQQAQQWSIALMSLPHATLEQRLQAMFIAAYCREPTPAEQTIWQRHLVQLAASDRAGSNQARVNQTASQVDLADGGTDMIRDEAVEARLLGDSTVWAQAAHAIYNTKEFIYYR